MNRESFRNRKQYPELDQQRDRELCSILAFPALEEIVNSTNNDIDITVKKQDLAKRQIYKSPVNPTKMDLDKEIKQQKLPVLKEREKNPSARKFLQSIRKQELLDKWIIRPRPLDIWTSSYKETLRPKPKIVTPENNSYIGHIPLSLTKKINNTNEKRSKLNQIDIFKPNISNF